MPTRATVEIERELASTRAVPGPTGVGEVPDVCRLDDERVPADLADDHGHVDLWPERPRSRPTRWLR